jgi:hypothetical protein
MLPATSEAKKLHFHTLNRATGNRVHARYVDAETGSSHETRRWRERDSNPRSPGYGGSEALEQGFIRVSAVQ